MLRSAGPILPRWPGYRPSNLWGLRKRRPDRGAASKTGTWSEWAWVKRITDRETRERRFSQSGPQSIIT